MKQERSHALNLYIQEKGEVHLRDLMALYPDLSAMTIRRDIDLLEKEGHIVRTRGGAKSISHLTQLKEENFNKRSGENVEAKRIIADKAVGLVDETGAVFLDSGSTIMAFSKLIADRCTFVITSGPNIAIEVSRHENVKPIILGGNLNPDNLSVSGSSAIEQIDKINIETAFIASSGFTPEAGFTVGNFDERELKQKVISKASHVIVLMDNSKIGLKLPYTFAEMKDIDVLVSEDTPSAEVLKAAEKFNVKIV